MKRSAKTLEYESVPSHKSRNSGMDKKTKASEKIGVTKSRRDSKSAWARASSRSFNEPVLETNGGLHTMQTTEFKKNRPRDSKTNIVSHPESREMNLTPPKAKELIRQMITAVKEDNLNEAAEFRDFDDSQSVLTIDSNQHRKIINDMDDEDNSVNMSLHIMERKLGRLEKQIKERDKYINTLWRNDNASNTMEQYSQIMSALEMSASLLSEQRAHESNRIRYEKDRLKEIEKEKRYEVQRIIDRHAEEMFHLREEQKKYFLDLQGKIFEWMTSRGDLIEQSINIQNDLRSLKQDYENLKVTSMKAFEDAARSIQEQCGSVKSLIKEEIRESEDASRVKILELGNELAQAKERILELEQGRHIDEQTRHGSCSDYESHEPITSVSSMDAQSVHQYSVMGDRSVLTNDWNDFSSRFREALDGRVASSDTASVHSKLDMYATMTAEKLFKNMYKKPTSQFSSIRRPPMHNSKTDLRSPSGSDFHDCDEE